MILENRGIPTVVVCTAPFQDAALVHAHAFGRANFEPVIIPHPLGGLDRDRVQERSRTIESQVIEALTRPD